MRECDILILEDEALIAIDIEMTLESDGHRNIFVCHTLDDANAKLDKSSPKVALLDFNLGNGQTSVPVAERLSKSDIPYILLTGYTKSTIEMPVEMNEARRLAKPFQSAELTAMVRQVLDGTL